MSEKFLLAILTNNWLFPIRLIGIHDQGLKKLKILFYFSKRLVMWQIVLPVKQIFDLS